MAPAASKPPRPRPAPNRGLGIILLLVSWALVPPVALFASGTTAQVAAVAAFGTSIAGWRVWRGAAPLVLYLRKFGVPAEPVGPAVAGGHLNALRVVTLHDGGFRPQAGYLAPDRLAVTVLASQVWWVLLPSLARASSVSLEPALMFLLPALVAGLAISVLVSILLGLVLSAAVSWIRRVRPIRMPAVRHTGDLNHLKSALLAFRSGWWPFSPLATTCEVADGSWRDAILEILPRVDAVIIDLSVVTPSLEWELRQTVKAGRGVVVLLRDDIALPRWAIQGPPIVRYSAVQDSGRMRQFSATLLGKIERLA